MLFTSPLRSFIRIVVASIMAGAFYAGIQYGTPMSGAVAGGQISAALFALEHYVLRRNVGGVFRPLPFLPYLALRSLLYITVIFIIVALPPRPPMAIESVDFLFTLVLVVGASLLLGVNDLLGPGVLFAFAAGWPHGRIYNGFDTRCPAILAGACVAFLPGWHLRPVFRHAALAALLILFATDGWRVPTAASTP